VKYESLIRRFQSQAEKDDEAKAKGYSRVLEGDLMRGEAKLASLKAGLTDEHEVSGEAPSGHVYETGKQAAGGSADYDTGMEPANREDGREMWNEFLTERFVNGADSDFDYSTVDVDEGLDVMEMQDAEDAWFEDEEPSWTSSPDTGTTLPQGETGVQDY
jgi:hypothetical protein